MKKFFAFCLLAGLVFCLAACTPTSEDLQKKYKDNDFEIEDVTVSEYGYGDDDITYAFKAVKSDDNEVTVISFYNGNEASEFYNAQYALKNDKIDIMKIGNTVIIGTKEAVCLADNKK